MVDAATPADLLGAEAVEVPRSVVRTALAAAWRAHLAPVEPALPDLALGLPLMDTSRARTELDREPRRSSPEALRELLDGMADGAGAPTPPAPDTPLGRAREMATGVGGRP